MARRRRAIFREEPRTLAVSDPSRYRLAVVSDSHGHPHPQTLARVSDARPDAILHAGDVGHLSFLDELETIAPVVAVRGNVDDRASGLSDAVALELHAPHGPLLGIYLTHVGVRGVRLLPQPRQRAVAHEAALVVCGHSHVPLIVRDGRLAVFNPGACGPRRFHLPIVFGVVDIGPDGVSLRHVDIETGARWRP